MSDGLANTIPISQFEQGLAGKVFAEVKRLGARVVMSSDGPECVLLSPEDYTALMDELNDAKLLALANERVATFSCAKLITEEEHKRKYGITDDMLKGFSEVEFE